MTLIATGTLKKMPAITNVPLNYQLPIGDSLVDISAYIGQTITLTHTGNIFCSHCGNRTNKSYAQGHCYVCMKKLASCDLCMMKPETCHYQQGTCKEPSWGEAYCMTDHFVYLSNTSGLKVGITHYSQIPTRWIDQGATQGLPIFKVKTRYISGLIEIELAKHIADKTNWRALLKGAAEQVSLKDSLSILLPKIMPKITEIKQQFGDDSIQLLQNEEFHLSYPVTKYPTKITSHNFDKNPIVTGQLQGIKGQYLIFDTGVINIRKFTSYEVSLDA